MNSTLLLVWWMLLPQFFVWKTLKGKKKKKKETSQNYIIYSAIIWIYICNYNMNINHYHIKKFCEMNNLVFGIFEHIFAWLIFHSHKFIMFSLAYRFWTLGEAFKCIQSNKHYKNNWIISWIVEKKNLFPQYWPHPVRISGCTAWTGFNMPGYSWTDQKEWRKMNELDFGSLWRMRLSQGFEEKVQLPHIYFK